MNDTRRLSAIVMAAGQGTRMRSATPKHLHPLLGRRMVDWVLGAVEPLSPSPLVVVMSPETADAFGDNGPASIAVQTEPRGTGDAVASARSDLGSDSGDVLVLSGDT
ncbi:MAG: NTP transferase domain-containing protein, partial [Gaiellaceae bacterium]